MAKVVMSARQARSLLKKAAQGKLRKRKKESVLASAASPGPEGACVITRIGKGTIKVCQKLPKPDCDDVDILLQQENAGHARWFPGDCP